jgi:hypothetical protein
MRSAANAYCEMKKGPSRFRILTLRTIGRTLDKMSTAPGTPLYRLRAIIVCIVKRYPHSLPTERPQGASSLVAGERSKESRPFAKLGLTAKKYR